MDFACSNMVIYDTSKSVSFIKVSETYYSTKISEKNWSYGYYFSQCRNRIMLYNKNGEKYILYMLN